MNAPLVLLLALGGPGAPGTVGPDRDWDLHHLHLDLHLDPARGAVEGSVELDLSPLLPPSPELVLDAVGLAVRAAEVEGAPVPYRLDGDHLHVTLDPARGRQRLTLRYAATPHTGLHARVPGPDSPDTYPELWSQGEAIDNRHWIPLPDDPNDRFTSSGRFTAPEGLSVVSNGLGDFDGEAWRWELREDLVSYLVMIAVGPYQRLSWTWRGRPVEQWLPPDAEPAHAEAVGALLPEMLDHLSERTGVDYPYPAYREVYVQRFLYTGMENTTSTIMHRRLLGHAGSDHPDDRLPSDAHESVAAHELAHQWYGDLLTCRTWSELWLNEGFATFMADDWMGRAHGPYALADRHRRRIEGALGAGALAGRFWSTPSGEHPPNSGVYNKGASVLRMLQVMVGERAFWEAIRRYTRDHANGLVETDDLRRAFEAVTGDHLRWFFDQWVHLPEVPRVTLRPDWWQGVLTVEVEQAPESPPRAFDLDLEIGTAAGPLRHRLRVRGARHTFEIPLDAAPRYVAADPDAGLLAHLDNRQSPEMWRAQLSSPSPYAALRALEQAGSGGPEAWEAALLPLLDHPDDTFAQRAMAASGPLGLSALDARLIEILSDAQASWGRRIAAAEALGKGRPRPAVAEALARQARPAPHLAGRTLAAAALSSLAAHDEAGALSAARRALRERPFDPTQDPWVRAALDLLGAHGEPDALDAALALARPGRSADVLHAALRASSALARRAPEGPSRDAAMARVARVAEGLLDDRSQLTRAQAVRALSEVGDRQSVAALEDHARREREPELQAQAREAASLIRRRAPLPSDAPIDGRVEDIEARLEQLSRAIEDLERRL